jgi:hypothetical protein
VGGKSDYAKLIKIDDGDAKDELALLMSRLSMIYMI